MLGTWLEHAPLPGWRYRAQLEYRARRDPFQGSTDWPEGRADSLFLAHVAASVMGRANLNANQGRLGRVQRLMLSVNRTLWPRQGEAGMAAERDSRQH